MARPGAHRTTRGSRRTPRDNRDVPAVHTAAWMTRGSLRATRMFKDDRCRSWRGVEQLGLQRFRAGIGLTITTQDREVKTREDGSLRMVANMPTSMLR